MKRSVTLRGFMELELDFDYKKKIKSEEKKM